MDWWKRSREWRRIKRPAVAMGREPYSGAELDAAKKVRDQLISANKDLNSGSGWARRHVDGTQFVKHLQKAAELSKWECDYKWASQNVHATYRELRALLGMSELPRMGYWLGHRIRDLRSPPTSRRSLSPNDIRLPDMLHRG